MAEIENSKLAIIGTGAVGTSIADAAIARGSAREVVFYDVNAARVNAKMLDVTHGRLFGGGETARRAVPPRFGQHQPRHPAGPDAEACGPCSRRRVAAGHQPSAMWWLLAERAGASASNVHAMIVGGHGYSEFPPRFQASVGRVPVLEWRTKDVASLDREELDRIAADVTNVAYRVIAGTGSTNYAIGLSAARIADAVLRDEGAVLPVDSMPTDYRGISGIALFIPSVM